jgi:hypothetical protein
MKSTFYLLFVLFLFLNISTGIYAQGQLIKVLDAKSHNPVPFASVHIIKQNVAFSTNENGFFFVSDKLREQKDTIRISCVGYIPKSVLLGNNPEMLEIHLQAAQIELPEIKVRPQKIKSVKTEKSHMKGAMGGLSGRDDMVGLSFDSIQYVNKMIESVMVYIPRGGDYKVPFRIRLFSLQNGQPTSEEFYQTNWVVRATKTGWNTFDIPSKDVYIPESGCLVAVEWLVFQNIDYSKIDYSKRDFNLDFSNYKGQYIGMGYTKMPTSSLGFYRNIKSKDVWHSSDLLFDNFNNPKFHNRVLKPMIALKLR